MGQVIGLNTTPVRHGARPTNTEEFIQVDQTPSESHLKRHWSTAGDCGAWAIGDLIQDTVDSDGDRLGISNADLPSHTPLEADISAHLGSR